MIKNIRKLIPFLLVIAMVFTMSGPHYQKAGATSVSEMKEKYNQLEEEAAELQKKVNASKSKINKTQEELKNIQKSISTTESQIDLLNEQIISLDKEIEKLDGEIAEIEVKIEKNYDMFKKRLRAMYIAGDVTNLDVLLGAQSFGEYLTRVELVKSVAKHDKELLESIEDSLIKIQEKQKSVETKKEDVADYKTTAEKKQALLKTQYQENKALVSQLEETMLADKEALAKAEAAKEKQNAAITSAIKAAENAKSNPAKIPGSSYTGQSESGFIWPVAGSSYVSSGYGYRSEFGKFHYGLDITGGNIYGRSVLASKSGLVLVAGWSNDGYGNYVVLQHSGGYATVYGHCSALTVSAGQTVKQGDVIAKVGSSGWSTGPHLHFEIRFNGDNVNPANYL